MNWHAQTALDTEELGFRLARARPAPGATPAVVYLTGELGAGKTTFARGFLHAHGVGGNIPSPTYTLVELYPAGELTIVHVDLYRIADPRELESLGLREWARPGFIWLIEWPERGADGIPPPDLALEFRVGASAHDIELTARSKLGESWLAALAQVPSGQETRSARS